MPHTRRDFLKYGGIGLGALALPSYDANSSNHGNLTPNRSLERTIKKYNTQRAWGILSTNGPAAVYKLGFERYIKDSIVEKVSLISGTAAGAYYLANTELGRKITRELTSDSNRLVEHVYEALGSYFSGKLDRRQFIATGLLLSLFACGGGTPPGPTTPSPITKATITGSVNYFNSGAFPVNGIVEFLDSPNGRIIASGTVQNANYTVENIADGIAERIKRVRFRGNAGEVPPFLVTELNTGANFASGANNNAPQYKLLGRVGEIIPSFYHKVNHKDRSGGAPEGLKKVTSPITYVQDMSTLDGLSDFDRSNAIRTLPEVLAPLNAPLTDFVGFNLVQEQNPQVGDGRLVIRHKQLLGTGTFGALPRFDGHRITGGEAYVPKAPDRRVYAAEAAATLWYLAPINDWGPSIANQPSTGILSDGDMAMAAAKQLETLGSKEVTSLDSIVIESFEPPV